MAALLVGLSVMAVLMSVALPVWSQMAKREKEEELIWRGQQYARAVGLFQRKYANTYPPSLDVLVEQRFLRKKYKDPVTNDDFQIIPATGGAPMPGMGGGPGAPAPGMTAPPSSFGGRGGSPPGPTSQPQPAGRGGTPTAAIAGAGNLNLGVSGVVSKSKATSIKIYNGRQKHNEWAFVYMQTAQAVGAPPGGPGGPSPFGMPGQPMPGGPGGGFTPFGPGTPGMPGGRGMMPGGRGMPPLPPGRGFQMPSQPGGPGQQPFGTPGQPGQPGRSMQPFGVPSRPPGN